MDAAGHSRGPGSGPWFARGGAMGPKVSRVCSNRTRSSSRPTNYWPFLRSGSSSRTPSSIFGFARRATGGATLPTTSQEGRSFGRPLSTATLLEHDLVPDYIVNFLRGETPETLARKREQRRVEEDQRRRPGEMDGEGEGEANLLSRPTSRMSLLEKMLPYHHHHRRQSQGRRTIRGWRGGLALILALAMAVFVVSLACLVIAAAQAGALGGEATLMQASCSRIRGADLALHVLVNLLAAVLVAGANYTFQVLTSPTRLQVTSAHETGRWLDLGVPSVRNLRHVSVGRAVLALVVVGAAVASQVIFNAITITLSTTQADSSSSLPLSSSSSSSPTCALTLERSTLAFVALLNLVSMVTVALALFRPASSPPPLVTLGDAIASFLSQPDDTTQGACLLSKEDVRRGRWHREQREVWTGDESRWLRMASAARWSCWALSWLVPVALASAALATTLLFDINGSSGDGGAKAAFASFEHVGFVMVLDLRHPRAALAVVASLPQLLLGLLYLTTNGLLSSLFLSHELCQFAATGALIPLRVSSASPLGRQVTSLYMTLPRPCSWLLFLLLAASGFALSQSLCLTSPLSSPTAVPPPVVLTVSPTPLVILLGLLLVQGVLVLGLSLRRAGPSPVLVDDGLGQGNPLALRGGSCSAVISARCHRMPSEGGDAALQELGWGVVYEGTGLAVGHATFSSRQVGVVTVGRMYA